MIVITILPLNQACECMYNFENGIKILTLRRRQDSTFHTNFYRYTFEKSSVIRGISNTENSRIGLHSSVYSLRIFSDI